MNTGQTAARDDAPLSKQRLRLWLQLLKATRHVESRLRENLRNTFATTLPRFDVMAMLDHAPEGLRMSDLSARLMVSNGNVTGIIDRLVNDGLVVRVPIEGDRRATLVRLTQKGRETFAEMAATHEAWVNELFAPLGRDDIERAIDMLALLRGKDE
ncbi:MAG: MarR family transcriptional regulator [Paracoccaceae bacterium]|nr:MarR family transcriptional regulator [Paracoccaceae bacterium]